MDFRHCSVEANVCKILKSDGIIVGTGCLIRTDDQKSDDSFKVATSKNLVKNCCKDQDGKLSGLVASFVNIHGELWKIELTDLEKDHINSEIAVFNVERRYRQIKFTSNLEGVPLINQNNFGEECYNVLVKSSAEEILEVTKLPLKDGCFSEYNELLVRDSIKNAGLAVQGAPILRSCPSANNLAQFVGIVDIPGEDGLPCFLQFRLQCTSQSDPHKPTQETNQTGKEDPRLPPGENLEVLWEDQYFVDDLCAALDFSHLPGSSIRDHRHLAQEFGIPKDIRQEIEGSEISPSERLFDFLESKRPNLSIEKLRDELQAAKAYQPLKSIQSAIKEKKVSWDDLVSTLADKNLALKNKLIIQLDQRDLWKGVANKFKISEKIYCTFSRNPNFNPTRNFFAILRTQSPLLKVSKLQIYLEELEEFDMLQKLNEVPGETFLKHLTSEAALMCDVIEPKLNATENKLLYKLAEKFQKERYISEKVDISREFQASECPGSPTSKVLEYVLTSQEEQYKIQDLKDRLVKIERFDCIEILAKYAKGFDDELKEVREQLERVGLGQLKTTSKPVPVERLCSEINDENENTDRS